MIFFPTMKRWARPKQQGLCSQSTHLWATSNFVPCSKALGTPLDGNNYVANLPTCGPHLILCLALKHWAPPPDGNNYVANLPTCGPLLIFSPALKHWGPPDGRGDEANLHTYGPLLILSPALKHWEPSGRHGLYSQSTQLWATRDILPH